MDEPTRRLMAGLAKAAAAEVRRATVRSGTVPAGTPEAVAALAAGLKPAAHVAPTRYGRTPYKRRTRGESRG